MRVRKDLDIQSSMSHIQSGGVRVAGPWRNVSFAVTQ